LSKLFLLLLAAAAIYLLIKGFGRKSSASSHETESKESADGERMVGCAHCGVNLPRSEAINDDGAYFCGEAHRKLGAR
jgi:uncharacterized protein